MADTPAADAPQSANDNYNPMPPRGYFTRLVDQATYAVTRFLFRTLFKTEVKGLEKLDQLKGQPTVIIANHTSFLDAPLVASFIKDTPAFAIDLPLYNKMMKNPVARFLLSRVPLFPLDPTKPQALRDLARIAKSGRPVMIFPEGRLTQTGTLMQIFDGAATVADSTNANIVPIHIEGMNFVTKMAKRLRQYPGKLFPRLSMTVEEPQKLDIPDTVTASRERRQARHDKLEEIMQAMAVNALDKKTTLMSALRDATRNFGRGYEIAEDTEGSLTYGDLLTRSYIMANQIQKITAKKENVGVLLPNSTGATVAFFGLQAAGRVATMLNAKAEETAMESYVQTASLKTILTSRRFVDMGKLQDKIDLLSKTCKIVYLEDVKQKLTALDKVKGLLQSHGLWKRPEGLKEGRDPAVILFTSGSESVPKGVVLSSTNILANITQMNTVSPITPHDKIFNAMPIFHSVGLSAGMLYPMLKGIPSFQYPNPLDADTIPKLIYHSQSTVMFGTDRFLKMYARKATEQDFASVRMVFAGAEKLLDDTYNTYFEKFGLRINEGYGMTEASPTVAINMPGAHRKGTVGKFLPGIEKRFEPVEGVEGYQLSIRGPNIMLGYLKNDKPGVIQPPKDGWHNTGDIVSMQDKYAKLGGRFSRFAKIGGEMVSLDTVEKIVSAASTKKDAAHAAVLQQSVQEGDSIIVFTTDPDLKAAQLTKAAGEIKESKLGLPGNADIHVLTEMPVLATGKTDYVRLKAMLEQSFNAASPRTEKATGTMGQTAGSTIQVKGQTPNQET